MANEYLRYINLPRIPEELLAEVPEDLSKFTKNDGPDYLRNYQWSDQFNQKINAWCQENICADMYWAFQFMNGDLGKHVGRETKIKFIYLVEKGGDNVHTRFWSDDHKTELADYVVEPHRWHILKVDKVHSVDGIPPGAVRWGITGRLFGE